MKKLRDGQAGFSILEVVIILVAIGVFSTTGWLIYQHDKTKVAGATANGRPPSSQSNTGSDTSTSTQPTTLDITQWGVQLTLNSTTASMYYYINPQLPDVAYLSLKTISDIAPKCAADSVSLGAISRLTTAQHQSALSNPALGTAGTIQIGDYWYGFTSPQGACIDSSTSAAVSQALPDYNAGTLPTTFNTLAAD